MKKQQEKKQVNTKQLVTQIVLWTLGGIALIFVLFWNYIFQGAGEKMFQIGTEIQIIEGVEQEVPVYAENGFVYIGWWFQTHIHQVVYTLVVVGIVALIIAALALLAKYAKFKNKKAATTVSLVKSFVKWGIILFAIYLILTRWGVPTQQILASIGIIALIIGLGCQTLISDVVAGIFLVADDAFEVGDIVVIDDFRGTVIEIGLKSTKLEDAGGNIKVVSNSAIHTLVNLTDSLSLSIVEISIPYEENLARTETLLIERLKDMKERIPTIVDGPYYKGVEEMADSAVILKVMAKVKEEDRFQTTRDMKRDIYIFLNENKITVPYPQLTITQGPNPADHPEWVDKEKEEQAAYKEAQKQQEASKDTEDVNDVK